MTKIVCDAGPIIHLHDAKLLHLTESLGHVFEPYQVKVEVEAVANFKAWPKWLRVQDILATRDRDTSMLCRTGDLQPGETYAIILARMLGADWFLTDDLATRVFAKSLGIEVHDSLGVVLWNAGKENLTHKQAENAIRVFAKSSLWLSARIIDEALTALQEITEDL